MSPPVPTLVAAAPETLIALPNVRSIEPDTLHVWCFMLDGLPDFVAHCRTGLSTEELARADRFVFERDRIRYTIAHAVLRHLLSLYCGEPAESLVFQAGPAGKPALHGAGQAPALRFNLSHSDNRALVAVSVRRELGADLERLRFNIDALSISRHYFFGSERAAIEAAPPSQCDDLFFRYWVAKEAVLKAQGIGLGFPLDRFRVDFAADGQTARVETFDPTALEPGWTVRMLPCEPGWLGAVVARGTDWRLVTQTPDL